MHFLRKVAKTNRILLITIVLALLAVGLFGCKSESKNTDQKSKGKFKAKASLTVVDADNNEHDFTMDDLRKLPAVSVVIVGTGSTQFGPKLRDVLKKAGITKFKKVTLEGTRDEPKKATLTSKQVTDETILDFTNRGTVKLATTSIPKSGWPKDITRITAE